jgi:hypothetical protein
MAIKHIPMRTQRALVATNPLQFGRGPSWFAGTDQGAAFFEDAKLFATTFAAGFLFVSIFLA